MNPGNFNDETLMAYADGELAADEARAVAAAAAQDRTVAQRIEFFQASSLIVQAAFDPVMEEPIPEHLRAAVMALGRDDAPLATTAPAAGMTSNRQRDWPGLAMAAAVACVFGVAAGWVGAQRMALPAGATSLVASGAAMSPALLGVFDSVPAGQQVALTLQGHPAAALPIASYGTAPGLCREVDVHWTDTVAPESVRLVGCRIGSGWRLEAVARATAISPPTDSYEPASGSRDLAASLGLGAPMSSTDEARQLRPAR